MHEFAGFSDCKAGQAVKMKGKLGERGTFVAHSITLRDLAGEAVIEDSIQSIDHEKNTLRILDHEITIPSTIQIKDYQLSTITWQGLRAGNRVKLTGKYPESRQFVPEKIKIKEPGGFQVAELKGVIDKLDLEKRVLEVLGFTIVVDERTTFYGS